MEHSKPRLEADVLHISEEIDIAQNYLNSDRPLTPKMISRLLHVEVVLHSTYEHERKEEPLTKHTLLYSTSVLVLSLALAFVVGSAFLYVYEIGPFYTSQ